MNITGNVLYAGGQYKKGVRVKTEYRTDKVSEIKWDSVKKVG